MFLYFANGKHSVVPPHLRYAFDDARNVAFRGAVDGPGGESGTVISAGADSAGYYPSKQSWRRIPKTQCFVGVNTDDELPTPDQLRRSSSLRGHTVTINGQQWVVPVAMSWSSDARWSVALPRHVEINDEGDWVYTDVVDRYRRLWDIAERWFDATFNRGEKNEDNTLSVDLREDEAYALASETLSFNYRVGPVELSILKAFETRSYAQILELLIDWPGLEKLLEANSDKKKQDSVAA